MYIYKVNNNIKSITLIILEVIVTVINLLINDSKNIKYWSLQVTISLCGWNTSKGAMKYFLMVPLIELLADIFVIISYNI